MIEPTTQTIITKQAKAEVVIKDWITAREMQAVQSVVFEKMKLDFSPSAQREGATSAQNIDPAAAVAMQNKQVETYVVSVNGEMNVMDMLLDLPDSDFQEVVQHINSLDSKKNSKTIES